jgi:hypothetical protein
MFKEELMQCIFLAMAALIYFLYAYLAFNERIPKDGSFFFMASMAVGFLYSLLWYWSARVVAEKNEYFLFVMLWDFVYISVFYFSPVLIFGVKLDKFGIAGLLTMVIGLLVMKMGHH